MDAILFVATLLGTLLGVILIVTCLTVTTVT
jgi:hypothetical protein